MRTIRWICWGTAVASSFACSDAGPGHKAGGAAEGAATVVSGTVRSFFDAFEEPAGPLINGWTAWGGLQDARLDGMGLDTFGRPGAAGGVARVLPVRFPLTFSFGFRTESPADGGWLISFNAPDPARVFPLGQRELSFYQASGSQGVRRTYRISAVEASMLPSCATSAPPCVDPQPSMKVEEAPLSPGRRNFTSRCFARIDGQVGRDLSAEITVHYCDDLGPSSVTARFGPVPSPLNQGDWLVVGNASGSLGPHVFSRLRIVTDTDLAVPLLEQLIAGLQVLPRRVKNALSDSLAHTVHSYERRLGPVPDPFLPELRARVGELLRAGRLSADQARRLEAGMEAMRVFALGTTEGLLSTVRSLNLPADAARRLESPLERALLDLQAGQGPVPNPFRPFVRTVDALVAEGTLSGGTANQLIFGVEALQDFAIQKTEELLETARGFNLAPDVANRIEAPLTQALQGLARRDRPVPQPLGAFDRELSRLLSEPAPARLGTRVSDLGVTELDRIPVPPPPEVHIEWRLDVARFCNDMFLRLKDSVVGYAFQLRQHGSPICSGVLNWSQTPADAGNGWTLDTRQHIASVSKLITAIAMTRALDEHNPPIPYNAKIIDYLPTGWTPGPGVDQITFAQLLTHRSGLCTGGADSTYLTMRAAIEGGVPRPLDQVPMGTQCQPNGGYLYENINFGLCRILIPVVHGDIDKTRLSELLFILSFFDPSHAQQGADAAFDSETIAAYEKYVQRYVFYPANVFFATLEHTADMALAYNFPADLNSDQGWSSGNMAPNVGGIGWHLSVNELLQVMGTFRRGGSIMSPARAQAMLDNRFGIDVIQGTAAGQLYNKNGTWRDAAGVKTHEEQALAYFLPEDMELGVLTNSPVGVSLDPNGNNAGQFFRNVVTNVYLSDLAAVFVP